MFYRDVPLCDQRVLCSIAPELLSVCMLSYSPILISMALETTRIYHKYSHLHDEDTLDSGEQLLGGNLSICRSPEESIALNMIRSGPLLSQAVECIIRHHLKYNIHHQGAHVIMIGFQAKGTLGRTLVDGANHIRMWANLFLCEPKFIRLAGFPRKRISRTSWLGMQISRTSRLWCWPMANKQQWKH
jgi:hypothetical protein